jgi:murein DD-endopeptidase MepM/ murein hydrolase activator NlpD
MPLLRPLRPVTRRFPVTLPFGSKGNYSAGYHTGIDYGVPVGTPVRSPRTGKVDRAGWDNEYGYHVLVKDWTGKKAFLVAHLSRLSVRRGQSVVRGQRLGYSGSTGNSTGPHLHAEQRHSPFGYWEHERPSWG